LVDHIECKGEDKDLEDTLHAAFNEVTPVFGFVDELPNIM